MDNIKYDILTPLSAVGIAGDESIDDIAEEMIYYHDEIVLDQSIGTYASRSLSQQKKTMETKRMSALRVNYDIRAGERA